MTPLITCKTVFPIGYGLTVAYAAPTNLSFGQLTHRLLLPCPLKLPTYFELCVPDAYVPWSDMDWHLIDILSTTSPYRILMDVIYCPFGQLTVF